MLVLEVGAFLIDGAGEGEETEGAGVGRAAGVRAEARLDSVGSREVMLSKASSVMMPFSRSDSSSWTQKISFTWYKEGADIRE